jgi:heme/copper-type cytochrome/quinol oxidase subunit 3
LFFGLLLTAAIVLVALLVAPWCKLSLHVACLAFAALLPGTTTGLLVFGGLGVAVAWSRLALARHDRRDLVVGLLVGLAAGWVFRHAAALF